jgi:hypothetical protein
LYFRHNSTSQSPNHVCSSLVLLFVIIPILVVILPPFQNISHFRRKKICSNYKSLYNTNATFNTIFPIISLTIYYSLFFQFLKFIFSISLMKDNFANQLIISLFRTILTTFFNLCSMVKTTYILKRMEYLIVYQITNFLFRIPTNY